MVKTINHKKKNSKKRQPSKYALYVKAWFANPHHIKSGSKFIDNIKLCAADWQASKKH